MAASAQDREEVKEFRFETVDVFTTTRYQGNPLAIVHVPDNDGNEDKPETTSAVPPPLTQAQKQKIANEFNLSETVILHGNTKSAYERRVDIFLVDREIPFAGHPTIGTLCHIGQHGPSPPATRKADDDTPIDIKLHIKAGVVNATYTRSTGVARASIPHDVHFSRVVASSGLPWKLPPFTPELAAMSFPVVSPTKGLSFVLVEVGSTATLSALSPSMMVSLDVVEAEYVQEAVKPSVMGAYFWAYTPGSAHTDATSGKNVVRLDVRMMMDNVGEDPATGSAACTLAAALSQWRRSKVSSTGSSVSKKKGEEARQHKPVCIKELELQQSGGIDRYELTQGRDMGRESHIVVEVSVAEDGAINEVVLEGQAVSVMKGSLKV